MTCDAWLKQEETYRLGWPIFSFAEKEEEAEVPEDLKLLADFGADVGIVGMEFQ